MKTMKNIRPGDTFTVKGNSTVYIYVSPNCVNRNKAIVVKQKTGTVFSWTYDFLINKCKIYKQEETVPERLTSCENALKELGYNFEKKSWI